MGREVVLPVLEAGPADEITYRACCGIDADDGDRAQAMASTVVQALALRRGVLLRTADHEQAAGIVVGKRVVAGGDRLLLEHGIDRGVDAQSSAEDRVVPGGVVVTDVERGIVEQLLLDLFEEVVLGRRRHL